MVLSKKRDLDGSRDLISGLPDPLIGHILSFLPTKEAASTSVLARKWRYLFALVSNLDFNDSAYMNPIKEEKVPIITVENNIVMVPPSRKSVPTSFMDFVDRVLTLQGNSPIHKFSLKIKDGNEPADPVDPNRVFSWILNVLKRGVSDLSLNMELEAEIPMPSKIFSSETLVTLKLHIGIGPLMDFEYVNLPNLKVFYTESVHFEKHGIGLTKFLSGCHILEDLVLDDTSWFLWDFASVSVTTLKRLRFRWDERDETAKSVSIDTPNLVYLEFTDTIADKYPKVNFDSLVEAKIDLRMSDAQTGEARFKEDASLSDLEMYYAEGHEENDLVANATVFIMGICNVKILSLSANTLEVLNYCCEAIPLFNNLTHLTIESHPNVGWESLPGLLKNSPNLETLVLQGLFHHFSDRCGDMCLCIPYEDETEKEDEDEDETEEGEEEEGTPNCLSSTPVKVLKVMKFGKIYDNGIEEQTEQVKYFVEIMPNLEQVILYYDVSFEENVIGVSTELQRLPRVALGECKIQLISSSEEPRCGPQW